MIIPERCVLDLFEEKSSALYGYVNLNYGYNLESIVMLLDIGCIGFFLF